MIDLTKYEIVDYAVVHTSTATAIADSEQIKESVMKLIKQGYVPLGGVSSNDYVLCQALVKFEPKKT